MVTNNGRNWKWSRWSNEFSCTLFVRNISFVELCFSFFLFSSTSQLSGIEAEEEADGERVTTYKVGMLGASEVGKTALTAQFTTSDYICAYDASLGKQMVALSWIYVVVLL